MKILEFLAAVVSIRKRKKESPSPDIERKTETYIPDQEYYRFQETLPGNKGKLTFTTELGTFTILSSENQCLYTCSISHILDYTARNNVAKNTLIIEYHLTQMPNLKGIRKSMDLEYAMENVNPQTNFFSIIWDEKYQGIHAFSVQIYKKTPIKKEEE